MANIVRAALLQAEWTGDQNEELLIRDLDLDLIDETRAQWAFYRDRRPDMYGALTES